MRRARKTVHAASAALLSALALGACGGGELGAGGAGGTGGAGQGGQAGAGAGKGAASVTSASSTGEGGSPSSSASGPGEPPKGEIREAQNPVLGVDHPDPHVLRVEGPDGKPVYYLTPTAGSGNDVSIFVSRDLLAWEKAEHGAFHRSGKPGSSLEINGAHYCHVWAPEIEEVSEGVYLLGFTAMRYASPQSPCPPYGENGGVYFASSASPLGPFAVADRPWEPLPVGGHVTSCPDAVKAQIPHSLPNVSANCQGTFCHHIVRLDSEVFRDPATGRAWLSYAWYTNTPPKVDWEKHNYGEHVSLVELDASDPFTVRCDPSVPQIHVGNPHDASTKKKLAASCERCGEMLDFSRGRKDEVFLRDGFLWGVVEGPSLFRRGEYVYALLSGGVWDSAYYSVFWVASKTVEGLSLESPERLVGRYLVPSQGQSFGHGTAVLGPDGESHYFVHHRLDHGPCKAADHCPRDVWVSPIEFEDRGDGLGEVWIKARFPAETPGVQVFVPG